VLVTLDNFLSNRKDIKASDYGPYFCEIRPTTGHGPPLYSDSVYVTQPHYQTEAPRSPGSKVEQWEGTV